MRVDFIVSKQFHDPTILLIKTLVRMAAPEQIIPPVLAEFVNFFRFSSFYGDYFIDISSFI